MQAHLPPGPAVSQLVNRAHLPGSILTQGLSSDLCQPELSQRPRQT